MKRRPRNSSSGRCSRKDSDALMSLTNWLCWWKINSRSMRRATWASLAVGPFLCDDDVRDGGQHGIFLDRQNARRNAVSQFEIRIIVNIQKRPRAAYAEDAKSRAARGQDAAAG